MNESGLLQKKFKSTYIIMFLSSAYIPSHSVLIHPIFATSFYVRWGTVVGMLDIQPSNIVFFLIYLLGLGQLHYSWKLLLDTLEYSYEYYTFFVHTVMHVFAVVSARCAMMITHLIGQLDIQCNEISRFDYVPNNDYMA